METENENHSANESQKLETHRRCQLSVIQRELSVDEKSRIHLK